MVVDVTAEGIFRISGVLDQVNHYKQMFDTGSDPDLTSCSNPHNISNLLKLYLRELPNPLLTYERYDAFVALASKSS